MTSQENIQNEALSLAMEWGENWLKSIQPRLREKYPDLSSKDLNQINKASETCMKYGHVLVTRMQKKTKRMEISYELWEKEMLTKYAWISKENMKQLFSQGMYYSMK